MAWEPPAGICLHDAYYEIAKKITNSEWNKFARSGLGLELIQNEIDEIMDNFRADRKEQKFRMCKKWEEKVGSHACVEYIYAVLNHYLFPKDCPRPFFKSDTLRAEERSQATVFTVKCEESIRGTVEEYQQNVDDVREEKDMNNEYATNEEDIFDGKIMIVKAACTEHAEKFTCKGKMTSHGELSNKIYHIIEKFSTEEWRKFAKTHLNLRPVDIEQCEHHDPKDLGEQKYQMVLVWQRRTGASATVKCLDQLVMKFHASHLVPAEKQHLVTTPEGDGNEAPFNFNQSLSRHTGHTQVQTAATQRNTSNVNQVPSISTTSPVQSIPLPALPLSENGSTSKAFEDGAAAENEKKYQDDIEISKPGVSGLQEEHESTLTKGQGNETQFNFSPTQSQEVGNIEVQAAAPVRNASGDNQELSTSATSQTQNVPFSTGERRSSDNGIVKKLTPLTQELDHGEPAVPTKMQNSNPGVSDLHGKQGVVTATDSPIKSLWNNFKNKFSKNKSSTNSSTTKDFCLKVDKIKVLDASAKAYQDHFGDNKIYPIETKGKVLILNNTFKNKKGERKGAELDGEHMEELWNGVGCEVTRRTDQRASDMMKWIQNMSEYKKGMYAYIVIVIMTHGKLSGGSKRTYYDKDNKPVEVIEETHEVFLGNDDEPVKVTDVLELFNNTKAKDLQGVPKLFIFQFCRGSSTDAGIVAEDSLHEAENFTKSLQSTISQYTDDKVVTDSAHGKQLPTISDILVAYPTQLQDTALRNEKYGSWFINAITNIFMNDAKDIHVADMLVSVNRAMKSKTSSDRERNTMKAMSTHNTSLEKSLFLFPGFPK